MSTRALLALLPLAGLVTIAAAQQETGRQGIGEIPTCRSLSSASRTRAACAEESTTVVRVEKEFTIQLEVASPNTAYCRAEIALEYWQLNTIARVEGVISNEECAASNGEHAIDVRVRDENGESKTLEFNESWRRDDDQPVMFTTDYPIGENVELVRVRTRRIDCVCTDSPLE